MSYDEFLNRHRRLAILRLLNQAPGYTAASTFLREMLGKGGLAVDQVNFDRLVEDLLRREFISKKETVSGVVLSITVAGQDVACGLTHVEDIEAPAPGE